MKYNLSNENEVFIFDNQVKYLRENKKICELKHIKKTRSNTQNRALHLWIKHISDELNEMGQTFHYQGITGNTFELPFNEHLVKEFTIKPIIKTLFNIDSTTKLTTENINQLIDVINKFMSDKGVCLPWPSIESLIKYYE
jgi:hypothetical protein